MAGNQNNKITAYISTKGRYQSTLPLAMTAIANQSKPPEHFILFDDNNNPRDLRQDPLYRYIFGLFDKKNIDWKVIFGQKKGQVANHQMALETATTPWLFRMDDDCVPESNVLELLISSIKDDVGAIAGKVIDPSAPKSNLSLYVSNDIEKIFFNSGNMQWFNFDGIKEVDHLYSSFLLRKDAALSAGGYCKDLSLAGHREETILTYSIKRAGWKLIVDGDATTWHFRSPEGGIRSYGPHPEYWAHDEQIFLKKLNEWGINLFNPKFIVLDCGLGDSYMFLNILPEIKEKYKNKKIIIAACYPDVFSNEGIEIVSVEEGKSILANAGKNINEYNVYHFCGKNKWQGHLIDAFRKLYLDD